MAGIAGLDVLNEMVTFFKQQLPNNIRVDKIWNEKSVGLGSSGYDVIFLGLDQEDPDIFSLQYKDSDGTPSWDWLHTVHFYIDIRTGKSEEHVLELVDNVMKIIKKNVIPTNGSKNRNIQLLPVGVTSLNEDYRNLFRYMLDCQIMVFNP